MGDAFRAEVRQDLKRRIAAAAAEVGATGTETMLVCMRVVFDLSHRHGLDEQQLAELVLHEYKEWKDRRSARIVAEAHGARRKR